MNDRLRGYLQVLLDWPLPVSPGGPLCHLGPHLTDWFDDGLAFFPLWADNAALKWQFLIIPYSHPNPESLVIKATSSTRKPLPIQIWHNPNLWMNSTRCGSNSWTLFCWLKSEDSTTALEICLPNQLGQNLFCQGHKTGNNKGNKTLSMSCCHTLYISFRVKGKRRGSKISWTSWSLRGFFCAPLPRFSVQRGRGPFYNPH